MSRWRFPAACKHSFIHLVHWADDWVTLCWSEGLEEGHFFRTRLQSASLLIIRLSHAASLFRQNPFKWIYSKILILCFFLFQLVHLKGTDWLYFTQKNEKSYSWWEKKKKRSAAKNIFPLSFFFLVLSREMGDQMRKELTKEEWITAEGRIVSYFSGSSDGMRRRSNQRGTFTAISVRLTPGPLD